jgi:drug/metabolite transporter (DMT)-like permease
MTGLLNGAEPLLIVAISALAQRRLPARTTAIAGLIGIAGIAVLTLGAGPALADGPGVAWIILSEMCWSLYCVIVPPLMQRRGALQVTAVTVTFGTIPMLLAGLPQAGAMLHAMTGREWEVLIILSVGTSVVALLCWNIGAAALGAEKSGYFLYLLPLIGVLGGAAYLAEPVTLIEFYGGALILASVFLSQRRA